MTDTPEALPARPTKFEVAGAAGVILGISVPDVEPKLFGLRRECCSSDPSRDGSKREREQTGAAFSQSGASGVQLRRRRATRLSVLSPSKLLGVSASSDLSTLSKVLTFTTAYRAPSITHVTIGTTPHVLHTWKSAVFVPNRYWPDWEASAIASRNRPVGCDVQTPRCFLQCPQPHARTGIVCPEPGQSSVNRMLPQ